MRGEKGMKRGSAWEERKEGGRGREKWRKVGKGERERGRMVTPNDYSPAGKITFTKRLKNVFTER